jgi:hypothetical protein
MKKYIILTFLLISCSTKKTSYDFKEHQKFDSINYHTKQIIYPSIKDTFWLKSPCDSLGNLKPFKQSFISSQGKVTLEGLNGHISAKIDLKGTSTTSTTAVNISKENTTENEGKIEIKTVTNWKLILLLVLSILLNIFLIYYFILKK